MLANGTTSQKAMEKSSHCTPSWYSGYNLLITIASAKHKYTILKSLQILPDLILFYKVQRIASEPLMILTKLLSLFSVRCELAKQIGKGDLGFPTSCVPMYHHNH